MKRLLLISYAFPPEPLPGALRPGYIARYLPRFGWEATVLTHSGGEPPFPVRLVRVAPAAALTTADARIRSMVPSSGRLRSSLRTIKDFVLFPDEMAPWIGPAVLAGLRLLRRERFDAILSTALPTSAHVVGAMLSRITGTPWLADYRDLWSGNPYMPWSASKASVQRAAELFCMRSAAYMTAVSEPIAQELARLHGRDVSAILNAHDPGEWDSIPNQDPSAFDLVYTGTMYDGKRSPELLFAAIAELREAGHPAAGAVQVHFYGQNNERARTVAQQYGLQDRVHIHGVVPRAVAMRAQRAAAALLIFLNMDVATANEKGSKYLEYLGAHRPMLVFAPEQSVMRETVERMRLGWFSSDTASAKAAVTGAYDRYTAGDHEFIANAADVHTAVDLTGMFAERLDIISGSRAQSSALAAGTWM